MGRHRTMNRRPFRKNRSKTTRNFREKVKRIISKSDESKFVDTNINSDTVPVVGTSIITPLSLIPEGAGSNRRIGDQVKLTSIEMKYTLNDDVSTTDIDTLIRIIIFRAKKNVNGVLPTVLDLLTTDALDSLRATEGGSDMSDFKVYLDKSTVLKKVEAAWSTTIKGKFFKSLGGLKCTFTGSGGAITDAEEGNLFILRMTNRVDTFQPAWNMHIRVRFKEL